MSENLARCRRCHDVFDAEEGICPRCGTPWQSIAAPPPPEEGTYVDRYRGTEYAEPEPVQQVMAGPGITPATKAIIGIGVGMLSIAVVVGAALAAGAFTPKPNYEPVIVSIAPVTPPPPTPTPQPETAMALLAINDPNLNAHIVIQSRVDEDSVISGHPFSVVVTMDCQVSNGEESAILTQGGKTQELRFVDGKVFLRILPSTKWAATPVVSSWAAVLPLFNLTTPRMIDFVGLESRDGQQAYHFRSSKWWVPDLNRMGLMDSTALGIKPDTINLDLWTDSFGKPIYASFSAMTVAKDGRKLLDIETTYTFTNVGTPVDVLNPLATPVPSASPPKS